MSGLYTEESIYLYLKQRTINNIKKSTYQSEKINPKQKDWYKITTQKTYNGSPIITRPHWNS